MEQKQRYAVILQRWKYDISVQCISEAWLLILSCISQTPKRLKVSVLHQLVSSRETEIGQTLKHGLTESWNTECDLITAQSLLTVLSFPHKPPNNCRSRSSYAVHLSSHASLKSFHRQTACLVFLYFLLNITNPKMETIFWFLKVPLKLHQMYKWKTCRICIFPI